MSSTSIPGPAPDALELAALLCSRVCHDLISPVGAIVNGLEVLDDNPKPEDREFALDLIRKSAKTASARLQFCRLAFGAAGSAGAQIDLGDAQAMAKGHIEDGKITLGLGGRAVYRGATAPRWMYLRTVLRSSPMR